MFSRARRKLFSITEITSGVNASLAILGLLLIRLRTADFLKLLQDVIVRDLEVAQGLGGNALLLLGEREQQVLGADLGGLEGLGLLFRK